MICMLKVIHYYWLMFLKNFRKRCLEMYELDPAKFLSAPGLAIRGGICHFINRYTKDNNKYMKDYDKNHIIIIFKILGCK